MTPTTLLLRTLRFHARAHAAVVLGAAAACASLTGALLVGDSMRGSLRENAVARLGPVDAALIAPRFFPESLADRLHDDAAQTAAQGPPPRVCPLILSRGSAGRDSGGERVNRVQVLGVDERFWRLADDGGGSPAPAAASADDLTLVLNASLARELNAAVGDDILLTVEQRSDVPVETLLGRRDRTVATLRLTLERIVRDDGPGGFSPRPVQATPFNAFVPLRTLQRRLGRANGVNALLVAGDASLPAGSETLAATFAQRLQRRFRPDDLGLRLHRDAAETHAALESESMLLEPPIEAAARRAAEAVGAPVLPVLTYLANAIERAGAATAATAGERSGIPYSAVTAFDPDPANELARVPLTTGVAAPPLNDDDILLNEWAASELGARPGDRIHVTYYVSRSLGRLETESREFTLRGVVAMNGLGADGGLTPEYAGIADAENLSEWDPPFPIDTRLIQARDEQYWDEYRAAPKAIVALRTGQRSWSEQGDRFGRLTSLRVPHASAEAFERELQKQLDPASFGLRFESLRTQAIQAGRGSTDFGMLFLGFSLFVIVSAAMLAALMFRLRVDRRAAEVGLLLAIGMTTRRVTRLLLAEGALLAGIGTLVGVPGGLGFAWLMLTGLRTWWSAAVNAPFLRLHVEGISLAIGAAAGLLVCLFSIWRGVRGIARVPPRALLAGAAVEVAAAPGSGLAASRATRAVLLACLIGAIAILGASFSSNRVPQAAAFFAGGALFLIAGLAGLSAWMASRRHAAVQPTRATALLWLGCRNAARNPRRSRLSAGLVASASFLIVAVGANRHEASETSADRFGGAGGYALVAEAATPLPFDLANAAGRRELNLSPETNALLSGDGVMPFRLVPGDEASCLNLYQVQRPNLLGASDAFIERGGFAFAASLAEAPSERANQWTLLRRTYADGAVPAIGDANTVQWLLHLGLGKDLSITDAAGQTVPLRIVATLSGSVLQGELVVAESRLLELFPAVTGHGFFLIELDPSQDRDAAVRAIEHDLRRFGVDAQTTAARLNAYLAVENTYLSTFLALGGIGLVLGTLGLGAVMLRGVIERRGELSLLRALGLRRGRLAMLVLAENVVLLLAGLAIGAASALLAVVPTVWARPHGVPWLALAGTLLAVVAAGMLSVAAALRAALRMPLLGTLRAERV
ncbi:MAG: FtsX-like permease family protein [Phycisphaerae bacterium]|nr:FtsX-like permease family protein [Phycisphaerae bacterium]